MGVSLTGMARSWRVLAVAIAGLALFAAISGGNGSVRSASAAICGDAELQPVGAATVSGCGVSRLQANPAGPNEIHFASGTNRAEAVSEAQQPPAKVNLGRAGRSAAPVSAASAASVNAPPPRKVIDLSQLPAGLVAPLK